MTLTAPTVARLLKMSRAPQSLGSQSDLPSMAMRICVLRLIHSMIFCRYHGQYCAARGVLDQEVILASLLELVHHVRDDDADELQDGDEQRAKRGGAGVEPRHLAKRSNHRGVDPAGD